MNEQDIKALKRRAGDIVRAVRAVSNNRSSATHTSLPTTTPGRTLAVSTKSRAGGFTVSLSERAQQTDWRGQPYAGYTTVGMIRWVVDIDAIDAAHPDMDWDARQRVRRPPMRLDLEADVEAVLGALAEAEADPAAAYQRRRDAVRAEEQARSQAREAELQAKLQAQVDLAAAHPEQISEIRALVERIVTVAGVRALLEGLDGRRGRFYIPQAKSWIVISAGGRVLLAHTVRFGGHIRGIRSAVCLDENPVRVEGTVTALEELLDLLRQHQTNPAAAAKAFGVCCVCARSLTDDESRKRGYGPDCAGKWRLPWARNCG